MFGFDKNIMVVIFLVAGLVFTALRVQKYGLWQGGGSAFVRILWVGITLVCLFPKVQDIELPPSAKSQELIFLVDDTQSMKNFPIGQESQYSKHESIWNEIKSLCLYLNCAPRKQYFSDYLSIEEGRYTDLLGVVDRFWASHSRANWILFSDGGHQKPFEKVSTVVKNIPSGEGLILAAENDEINNIWISQIKGSDISFEGQQVKFSAVVKRRWENQESTSSQLQVISQGKVLATENIVFKPGETELIVNTTVPSLSRGYQLLTFNLLPAASESFVWDNRYYKEIDVRTNTIGVLHLLGAPSWDGRYLRRYLKSEPKYDLISFFILRDPTDSQQVEEREMSLIPFPVERLFTEELGNFKVLIIQNFALFQFLDSRFQENLIKFVEGGGSLLFIGGPRALQPGDVERGPLKSILPFEYQDGKFGGKNLPNMNGFFARRLGGETKTYQPGEGPFFDMNRRFKVVYEQPEGEKRQLANIIDAWQPLSDALSEFKYFKGIHHMENVNFFSDRHTPLLSAKLDNGNKVPLVVASYPGKGRALWVFSDSFWKLSLASQGETPASTYRKFFQKGMSWLLRNELKPSLEIAEFSIAEVAADNIDFSAILSGPVAKYLHTDKSSWQLSVCDRIVDFDEVDVEKINDNTVKISGIIATEIKSGEKCYFEVKGIHKAFGSLVLQSAAVIDNIFPDDQTYALRHKLEELASYVGANFSTHHNGWKNELRDHLQRIMDKVGTKKVGRKISHLEHYWIFDQFYIYFLAILIPLEILILRYRSIFGRQE